MKPIIIQNDVTDAVILALATDIENAQYATWRAFGAMLRDVLPRVLEGWTADDISAITLGDLRSLPAQLMRALALRQSPMEGEKVFDTT